MTTHDIATTEGRRELARQVIYEHGTCVPDLDDGYTYIKESFEGMVAAGIFAPVELDDEDYEQVSEFISSATVLFPSQITPDQMQALAEYSRWMADKENTDG